jgi:hypothetical protein
MRLLLSLFAWQLQLRKPHEFFQPAPLVKYIFGEGMLIFIVCMQRSHMQTININTISPFLAGRGDDAAKLRSGDEQSDSPEGAEMAKYTTRLCYNKPTRLPTAAR